MQLKAAVVGAAGFAGIELVRILLSHPSFSLEAVTSDANSGMSVSEMYPAFTGKSDLVFQSNSTRALMEMDVVFLAVPHTAAMGMAPALIEAGVTVIDLSADFRLKDPAVFEEWYSAKHTATDLLAKAAFGLPEIKGSQLQSAAAMHASGEAVLVGCAGCYPTATSLAAAPAVEAGWLNPSAPVIADAISGITGAGKKATERTHFCFADENLEAYGVTTHRHTPEIEQILGIPGRLLFTPHLAPLNRGLLSTVNIPISQGAFASGQPLDETHSAYCQYYSDSPFVHVLEKGKQPRTASVAGTNNAYIGLAYSERTHTLVATCAIDNLGKGAAGQAVQCANIVFGLPQSEGLTAIAQPV